MCIRDRLIIILVTLPIINFLFRHVVAERMGTILISAVLAHSGWHWMSDRASELVVYRFEWPAMNYVFFASLIRWVMLLIIIGAILGVLVQTYDRFLKAGKRELSQSPDSG